MNFRLSQPAALVDLNNVPELFYIRPAADGGVLIGAMTRTSTVEHDPLIAERAPLLAEVDAPHRLAADPQPRHLRRQHRPCGSRRPTARRQRWP